MHIFLAKVHFNFINVWSKIKRLKSDQLELDFSLGQAGYLLNHPRISNNVVCATNKGSDQSAHTHSLIRVFASRLNILLLLSYCLNSILSFEA